MDDHPPLTPNRTTAQADIRNCFHTSLIISPPALTTPSTHPVAHVRARSDAAHNVMYDEWEAPVYKPRTPRGSSDGDSIRKTPPNPQHGQSQEHTAHFAQIQVSPARSRSGSFSAHRNAQTEDLTTKVPTVSRRRTSDGETLSRTSFTLLRDSMVMDHSLVPKPLKPTSHHSPSPSGDRIDTSDSFMEGMITSTHEKRGLDIDPPSTKLTSEGSHGLKETRRITTKPIYLKPELQSSRLTWDDEAVMYRLPSPALTPSVPEKARRILGTADIRSKIVKPQRTAQPDCEIYAGPAWANECHTSRHKVETNQEVRIAKGKSIGTSGTSSKKKKKGGRFAKLIFGGGAVDDQ